VKEQYLQCRGEKWIPSDRSIEPECRGENLSEHLSRGEDEHFAPAV